MSPKLRSWPLPSIVRLRGGIGRTPIPDWPKSILSVNRIRLIFELLSAVWNSVPLLTSAVFSLTPVFAWSTLAKTLFKFNLLIDWLLLSVVFLLKTTGIWGAISIICPLLRLRLFTLLILFCFSKIVLEDTLV